MSVVSVGGSGSHRSDNRVETRACESGLENEDIVRVRSEVECKEIDIFHASSIHLYELR